ncbi:MAG: AI-2E family transporter, partial [Nanoarchaeota archaeon]|nr:AI-2E family transporter [Nanoarchaeota archaeon]
MESDLYQKIIFTIVFIVLIFISFLIIKPFLAAVLTGIVLSYIFYPLYSRINKRISNKNVSSLIASLLVILILTAPLFFVLNAVSKEAYTTYLLSRQKMAATGQLAAAPCEPSEKAVCQAANYIISTANDPRVRYYLEITIKGAATKITDFISKILFSIPTIMIDVVIILFIMFFLFRDGAIFIDKLGRIMPLKSEHREHVFRKVNDMAYAVVYGSLIIAI